MKQVILFISTLLLILSCQNKNQKQRWLKGNLHTHTYWSDGDAFPEMVLDWYKSNSYDFVSLTDHNTLQKGEKWKKIPQSFIYQDAFQDYLKKYGEAWVTYEKDSSGIKVKLKTEEDYLPLFQDENFLIIRGEEVTDSFDGKPLHINATNIKESIDPRHGKSVADVLQNNINAILAQREATGQLVMPHINHPNFGWAISVDDLIALKGERFFEVFNGHNAVRNYGDSTHLSTEEMWDLINIAYLKRGQPLMYGIATDDSHYYHQFGLQFSNSGRGWVMVNAEKLEGNSIVEAMERGDFYASTGVTLQSIELNNLSLDIQIASDEGVSYTSELIGVLEGTGKAQVIETQIGDQVSFEIPENTLFVRVKIVSSELKDNPFQEGDFETAWLQPILIN